MTKKRLPIWLNFIDSIMMLTQQTVQNLLFSQWVVSRNNIEILHFHNSLNLVFQAHEVDIDTFREHHKIRYQKMFLGLCSALKSNLWFK